MSARDHQIAFEASLQNGDLVTARWTHKGHRYQAKAKVLDLRMGSIAVLLQEGAHAIDGAADAPAFSRGEEVSIPRRENRIWSIHRCVYLPGEYRECARDGCKVKISPEEPERKQYCSSACRLAVHKNRKARGQDQAGLIEAVAAEIRRVGDLALSSEACLDTNVCVSGVSKHRRFNLARHVGDRVAIYSVLKEIGQVDRDWRWFSVLILRPKHQLGGCELQLVEVQNQHVAIRDRRECEIEGRTA